jgi:hypothetical protein
MTAPDYELVAVTTATEDGVATPSTGAGGGVTGGGVPPDGGGVDEALPLPPQPASATNKRQEDVMSRERMDDDPPETVVAAGSRLAHVNPASRRIGAAMRHLEGTKLEHAHRMGVVPGLR